MQAFQWKETAPRERERKKIKKGKMKENVMKKMEVGCNKKKEKKRKVL